MKPPSQIRARRSAVPHLIAKRPTRPRSWQPASVSTQLAGSGHPRLPEFAELSANRTGLRHGPEAPLTRIPRLVYPAGVYQSHRSQRLLAAFRAKPFQGARPQDAEFVFVGLDANYDPDIEQNLAVFDRVLEYHEDGVAFWKRRGVHHPFLLADYGSRDGLPYHRNFARIRLGPEHAERISFVELLHLPTMGRSKLVKGDLDPSHLEGLNVLIQRGAKCRVFLSDKVIRLMRASKHFPWLRESVANQVLPVLHQLGQTTVYQYLHFSNYGRFKERMTKEAAAIAALATVRPQG